jgi:GMP synthase-like glutamine amidotransferase
MKLGLLLCDDVPARLRHIAGGYRDMFDALLRPYVPDVRWSHFEVHRGEMPPEARSCDAWVCTGSRYSVYEDRPWIGSLKAFVRDVHAAGTPFVGICFGHQVLADALGGRVARSPEGWGIGVREMTVVVHEEWMEPPLSSMKLQYMHGDQVESLPAEAVVLARAPHCEVALFRVGETLLGVEGHPEFPAAFERALLEIRRESIGAAEVDAALATVDQPTDHGTIAQWITQFVRRAAGG